ncbi:MAG: hypothetical protein IPL89_17175 [Acidobacteria bacterium]|nr:hypothetical protein [Acidobacteriota bacterium]
MAAPLAERREIPVDLGVVERPDDDRGGEAERAEREGARLPVAQVRREEENAAPRRDGRPRELRARDFEPRDQRLERLVERPDDLGAQSAEVLEDAPGERSYLLFRELGKGPREVRPREPTALGVHTHPEPPQPLAETLGPGERQA